MNQLFTSYRIRHNSGNIPFSNALGEEGVLSILYNAGIKTELFPVLIFIAVGAMIDFGPLLKIRLCCSSVQPPVRYFCYNAGCNFTRF